MQDFQQRVVDEKNDLHEKIEKLSAFIETETFIKLPFDEQGRLKAQQTAMEKYREILLDRIANFKV